MTLPCGTFAESYQQDKAIVRTRLQWGLFIVFLAVVFLFPTFAGNKFISMAIMMAITIVAVVGLQLTTGYAGQINMGQSAFMGVGAYVTAALAFRFDLPFWLTIPIGGLGAALFGAAFGIPALRIKGFYLALTTIAAQYIYHYVMLHLPKDWFGAAEGIRIKSASLGSFVFDDDTKMYYLIITITVIMVFFAYGVVRSRTGRAFVAVRDNDIAADIMGVNVFAYKTLAFFVGAFFAGIAGGLWAYYLRYVAVDQFTLWFSVWYVGMIIVGGQGSILGAIIGTVFVRGLQEIVTAVGPQLAELFPQAGGGAIWYAGMNVLLGGVIILFLIFEPRGLAHRWSIFKGSYRIWPFPY